MESPEISYIEIKRKFSPRENSLNEYNFVELVNFWLIKIPIKYNDVTIFHLA